MARLAADLRDLLVQLDLQDVTVVGGGLRWVWGVGRGTRSVPASRPCGCDSLRCVACFEGLAGLQQGLRTLCCLGQSCLHEQVPCPTHTQVGTSMGVSVIWAYIELYGEDRLKQVPQRRSSADPSRRICLSAALSSRCMLRCAVQAVFVDQAPLQNVAPDWK